MVDEVLQVDSVIQETKNLMNEIAKLVTACFVCATKVFKLLTAVVMSWSISFM